MLCLPWPCVLACDINRGSIFEPQPSAVRFQSASIDIFNKPIFHSSDLAEGREVLMSVCGVFVESTFNFRIHYGFDGTE